MLCLPRGNSSTTIHLLIHSSLIDYSWSSCLRKQVLVILVMITCMLQKLKCYHLCFCHLWPWEQLGSLEELWVQYAYVGAGLLYCIINFLLFSISFCTHGLCSDHFHTTGKTLCVYLLVNKKLKFHKHHMHSKNHLKKVVMEKYI